MSLKTWALCGESWTLHARPSITLPHWISNLIGAARFWTRNELIFFNTWCQGMIRALRSLSSSFDISICMNISSIFDRALIHIWRKGEATCNQLDYKDYNSIHRHYYVLRHTLTSRGLVDKGVTAAAVVMLANVCRYVRFNFIVIVYNRKDKHQDMHTSGSVLKQVSDSYPFKLLESLPLNYSICRSHGLDYKSHGDEAVEKTNTNLFNGSCHHKNTLISSFHCS